MAATKAAQIRLTQAELERLRAQAVEWSKTQPRLQSAPGRPSVVSAYIAELTRQVEHSRARRSVQTVLTSPIDQGERERLRAELARTMTRAVHNVDWVIEHTKVASAGFGYGPTRRAGLAIRWAQKELMHTWRTDPTSPGRWMLNNPIGLTPAGIYRVGWSIGNVRVLGFDDSIEARITGS